MATTQTSVGSQLREKYDAMTPEDQEQLADSLREAIYYLAACWDACFQVEVLCGQEFDVESDNLSGITGEIGDPAEAHSLSIGDIFDRMEDEADQHDHEWSAESVMMCVNPECATSFDTHIAVYFEVEETDAEEDDTAGTESA